MFRRTLGRALVALPLITALSAPTALGLAWNDGAFTGRIGQFEGPPAAEVVCRYSAGGLLRSVTVQPLRLWGSHENQTVVGWRYQLREAVEFHRGRLLYNSPVWKDFANTSTAADGFTQKRFYVSRDLSRTSAYYVRPVMFWYAPDSTTTVEGRGVVLYDRYVKKMGTQTVPTNACTYEFADTWGTE